MNLSEQHKCLLIQLAGNCIKNHFKASGLQEELPEVIPDTLKVKCGVFVSLYVGNSLRGCIGTFSESELLLDNVRRMALAAATSDSRFTPIGQDELLQLSIEISVLSPKEQILGPEEIVIGKHGVFIQKGHNRGTLLPQVAVNEGWNAQQLLGHCSKHKAGLGWNGWKSAELFSYEAIVFKSNEIIPDC
jgi:AmmeMemoRadiSam system protein A